MIWGSCFRFRVFAAAAFLLAAFSPSFAQDAPPAADPLTLGLEAYSRSDWASAILHFREAASANPSSAEPWFWLIMAEISDNNFEHAFSDIDRFVLSFSNDSRVPDVLYQKGRLEFLTSSYDAAIQTLYGFIAGYPSHKMVPSAYYWIAETLFACGRLDDAASIYTYLVDTWPQSAKHEAALYRLALIEGKNVENELLSLLQISHEESLRISEDYQRRERTYEQALASYQRRISDMMKDTRLSDIEASLEEERRKNAELLSAAALLEAQNADLISALIVAGVPIPQSAQTERTLELESASAQARESALEELRARGQRARTIYESGGGERQ